MRNDTQIFDLISDERRRQMRGIELIGSWPASGATWN